MHPAARGWIDAKGASDIRNAIAILATLERLTALMRGELRRRPICTPRALAALRPSAVPEAISFALKLRNRPQDIKQQLAMRRGGVEHRVVEHLEISADLLKSLERNLQIVSAPSMPIEQNVAETVCSSGHKVFWLWPHFLQANATRPWSTSALTRFGAPHLLHFTSSRVLPCVMITFRAIASLTKRSDSWRIASFDIAGACGFLTIIPLMTPRTQRSSTSTGVKQPHTSVI
jgi:hypothetical protein